MGKGYFGSTIDKLNFFKVADVTAVVLSSSEYFECKFLFYIILKRKKN